MMRHVPTLLCALGVMLSATAVAKEGPLADAPPILDQTLWRAGRVELAPTVSLSIPDPFTGSVAYEQLTMVGLQANYFILDWLGVGLDLGYGISSNTSLHDQVDREIDAKRNAVCGPDPGPTAEAEAKTAHLSCLGELGLTDNIRTSSIQLLASANVSFVPLHGKFMLFDSILMHYDVHALLGVGFAVMQGEPDEKANDAFGGVKFAGPVVGLGARTFFNDWIGLNLEFRDTVIKTSLTTNQEGNELPSDFRNFFTFTVGVSFILPPETSSNRIE